jgi:glutaredoxin
MIERLIVSLVLMIAAGGLFSLLQMVQRQRLSGLMTISATPKVLYFRADSCAGCATQKRYLDEIDAPIETIDVERDPEKAAQFNVMTLPSTIVVDSHGTVRHINYGVTTAQKLSKQLASQ